MNNYYIETGMSSLIRQNIYKCSAWGNCPTSGQVLYPSGPVLVNSSSTKFDSYSVLYGFAINTQLLPEKVYSISYDFCTFGGTLKSVDSDVALFSRGLGNSDFTQGDIIYHGTYTETNKSVVLGSTSSNACYRTYFTGSNYSGVALRSYFYTKNNNISHIAILGYNISYIGEKNNLSDSQISSIVNNAVNNSTNSINQNINEMNNNIKKEIQESADKIYDADLDPDKTTPADDSSFKDFESAEGELTDIVDDMDLDDVQISIDFDTSNFIWSTATRIIESNSVVFTMVISVLSVGVIKLMFGR